MKIVTFRRDEESWPEVGIVRGDRSSRLGANCPTPTALIENWPVAKGPILEYLEKAPAEAISPSEDEADRADPPPPKLICVGLNYRDHAIESNMEIPKVPTIFNKFSTSIIGPGDQIVSRRPRRNRTTKPNLPSSSARADVTSRPKSGRTTCSATQSSTM